jgi:hypothetical protein
MAFTVGGAFLKFRQDTVDLIPDQSDKARSSRDWLFDQLVAVGNKDADFPKLIGKFVNFGSFARKTKIRPLDDIDMMILLNGTGTTLYHYPESTNPYSDWLRIDSPTAPLAKFPDGHGFVNSTKVLNRIRDKISTVPQYEKADIKRTGEAVTLNLRSYSWVFDIVPSVPVVDSKGNIIHYAIPDGNSNWKKTDPRIDQKNVTSLNIMHKGMYIPAVRMLKYWNRRTHKPRLSSYYFETIVQKVFSSAAVADYPEALKNFFISAQGYVQLHCADPQGLGPNLDAGVDSDTKQKVIAAMKAAWDNAWDAVYYEGQGRHKEAIEKWSRIFGPEFPSYG